MLFVYPFYSEIQPTIFFSMTSLLNLTSNEIDRSQAARRGRTLLDAVSLLFTKLKETYELLLRLICFSNKQWMIDKFPCEWEANEIRGPYRVTLVNMYEWMVPYYWEWLGISMTKRARTEDTLIDGRCWLLKTEKVRAH